MLVPWDDVQGLVATPKELIIDTRRRVAAVLARWQGVERGRSSLRLPQRPRMLGKVTPQRCRGTAGASASD